MINEHDLYDLFFRYEHGTLQTEELQLFQERLKNEEAFREAFENYQLAGQIVLTDRLYQVRKKLNQLDYDQTDPSGNTTWKYVIAISGAFFLVGLGYYLLREDNTTTVASTSTKEINLPPAALHAPARQDSVTTTSSDPAKDIHTTIPDTVSAVKQQPYTVTTASPTSIVPFLSTPDAEEPNANPPKPQPSVQRDPCKGISIEAKEILTDPTCQRTSNGKITVKTITGGQPPYHCLLNQRSYSKDDFTFEYLPAGDYELKIIDQQQCSSSSYFIEVKEKNCEKDFALKPSAGIYWTPTLSHANANIHIQDKTGNIILNKKISGQEFTWEGTDQYGSLLPNGLYFYTILYDNGEKESGTITIIE